MESGWDFLEWLGPDTSTTVLTLLDDPADLVRVSSLSRSWRRFVITNGFSKSLCLRICPEVACFTHVTEVSEASITSEAGSSYAAECQSLEREHKIYSFIGHLLISSDAEKDCICQAICASSTDNYPDESIVNTLEPSDLVDHRPSYWSSGGQEDPRVSESLTYRLSASLCLVNEIKIQPFKAFFQIGHPIYSAKSVRFRMGYSRFLQGLEIYTGGEYASLLAADENYNWMYVSPEFPMSQENTLQSFKLPHPVLCIGGILQIELMGRVQKQAMDNLYYICASHVEAIGSPLSPVLEVDIPQAGRIVLKYFPNAKKYLLTDGDVENVVGDACPWNSFTARLRRLGSGRSWNQTIIGTLLRPIQLSDDEDVDEDDDEDDDEDEDEDDDDNEDDGSFEEPFAV